MPEEKTVLTHEQKDKLFARLRDDPKFRELMKKDWRAAFKESAIDPDAVVNGTLSRQEIDNFALQRAGWEIIVVIFVRDLGLPRVSLSEAVNFEAR